MFRKNKASYGDRVFEISKHIICYSDAFADAIMSDPDADVRYRYNSYASQYAWCYAMTYLIYLPQSKFGNKVANDFICCCIANYPTFIRKSLCERDEFWDSFFVPIAKRIEPIIYAEYTGIGLDNWMYCYIKSLACDLLLLEPEQFTSIDIIVNLTSHFRVWSTFAIERISPMLNTLKL